MGIAWSQTGHLRTKPSVPHFGATNRTSNKAMMLITVPEMHPVLLSNRILSDNQAATRKMLLIRKMLLSNANIIILRTAKPIALAQVRQLEEFSRNSQGGILNNSVSAGVFSSEAIVAQTYPLERYAAAANIDCKNYHSGYVYQTLYTQQERQTTRLLATGGILSHSQRTKASNRCLSG